MADEILIEGLELAARLGVPEEERRQAQRLTAHLRLVPPEALSPLEDRIENTVDYAAVAAAVRALAGAGERRLLETLAEDIAELILREFAIECVTVELRKYILVETSHVAVRIERPKRLR